MSPIVKKKLIRKIRNRVTAQRSRDKQKIYVKNLEEQNLYLKSEINNYKLNIEIMNNTIIDLESNNTLMKQEITKCIRSNNYESLKK